MRIELGPHTGIAEYDTFVSQESPLSSRGFEDALRLIVLPETVKDLQVLDVGAGCSDLVPYLLKKGADAYAVDPKFRNRRELIEKAIKAAELLAGQLKRRELEAIASFKTSSQKNPERYVCASAIKLPFPDSHFTTVVSLTAIFGYLDPHYATLLQAVSECLRVTKPGGTVQLFPVNGGFGYGENIEALRSQNHDKLRREVAKRCKVACEYTGSAFLRMTLYR